MPESLAYSHEGLAPTAFINYLVLKRNISMTHEELGRAGPGEARENHEQLHAFRVTFVWPLGAVTFAWSVASSAGPTAFSRPYWAPAGCLTPAVTLCLKFRQ
jgi:hypothetical protein